MAHVPAGFEASDSEEEFCLGPTTEKSLNGNAGYVHNWQPKAEYQGGFAELSRASVGQTAGMSRGKPRLPRTRPSGKNSSAHGVSIEELKSAVMKCNSRLVQEYLNRGIPVDTATSSGWTVLMYAASDGNRDMVKLLIENGASVNCSKGGVTPLMTVCESSQNHDESRLVDCAKELIAAGADVNARDWHRQMAPLMMAAVKGYSSVVELLIENGAEVNQQDQRKWTALGYAIASKKPNVVRLLLEKGADTTEVTQEGQDARDLALSFGHPSVIALFPDRLSSTKESGDGATSITQSACAEVTMASQPGYNSCEVTTHGDLETFLTGLNLPELISLFYTHGVTFSQLLTLTDSEMQKMGIAKVGDRRKLLEGVHGVHKKDWEPSSLPPCTNVLTCADMTAMLANMQSHFKYMASTLTYMGNQIKERPQLLDPGNDGKGVAVLKHQIGLSKRGIENLACSAGLLEAGINQALADTVTEAADVVASSSSTKSAYKRRRSLFAAAAVCAVALAVGVGLSVKLTRLHSFFQLRFASLSH